MNPPTQDLHARTSSLPPAFDLLAACGGPGAFRFLFEREGLGVAAGPRTAATGPLVGPATQDGLRALGHQTLTALRGLIRDRSAPSPVAVGQFPFATRGEAWMQVPARAVRRTDRGDAWLIDVARAGSPRAPFKAVRPVGGAPARAFDAALVRERPPAAEYAAAVADAVERIAAGELRKVVLARTVEVDAGRALDPLHLAHRLRAVDPHAYTFIAPLGWGGMDADTLSPLLVGASPELLLARHGRAVGSTPLAGSAPRAGDPEEDREHARALHASAKDREEHAIVVEAIAATLGPLCEELHWDPEPVLLETANVWHLATRFAGVLRDPAPSALDLVAALHPTPAVGGSPTDVARSLIQELEPFDRDGYAGPVGWMDADGDGEWAIALRCARLQEGKATLYAGAGIVAASDPASEVEETERKFRAFLDSLRWG